MKSVTIVKRSTLLPHLLLGFYALVVIVPVLNMVLMSFKSYAEILRFPLGLPSRWHWENYLSAWTKGNLGQLLANTLLVGLASTALVLVCGSMAAYVIARFAFRGNQPIYLTFMAGMALPVQMLAIPMFVVMRQLSLIDNLLSLILAYSAAGLAFSVFLLVNFVRSIPRELDEAAYIDGAGPGAIFVQIILPLLRPALTTVGVFQFVAAWNGFFFPLVFIQDPEHMTVTVGVLSFVGQYGTEWDLLLPALVIVMIPTILVFVFASKQFTRNIAAGAVKM
jgi:raffinose/stachyose/melibiose transport system permease protein